MRLEFKATLHKDDDFAKIQWEGLSERSRRIYALKNTPGEPVDDPKSAYIFDSADRAFEHFGVVSIQVRELESLQLERPDRTDYHIRVLWDLDSNLLSYLAP